MKALGELVGLVASEQKADGSFASFSSPDRSGTAEGKTYRTTFLTSQIAAALSVFEDERARSVAERAAVFLKSQLEDGSVNYWQRGSEEFAAMRLPDDMDDTSCAMIALFACGASAKADGGLLGGFTRALVDTEVEPGGPYRTWRLGPDAEARWKDIDPAVNANVAYALECVGVRLKGLDRYLDDVVNGGLFASPYYPDALPILYFFSRLHRPEWHERIHQALEALRVSETGWGNGMRNAMAVSTLLRTGGSAHVSSSMLESLGDVSTLLPSAFCLDPALQGVPYYAGSRALDAALRIEALALAMCSASKAFPVATDRPDEEELHRHRAVLEEAYARLPEGILGDEMAKLLKRIEGFDAGKNVTLTPWRFSRALGLADDESLTQALGLANLFGWAAYTAYDDILDGDAAGELVSPANAFLRRLHDVLSDILPANAEFQAWWREVMDRVDEANAWELAFCRFDPNGPLPKPDMEVADALFFSERSLGHAIGPVAILCANGYSLDDPATTSVLEAFRCYLTARQMHDDAHDWQDDLKDGQLNSVSLRMLRTTSATNVDALRLDFWQSAILDHSERINEVCRRGHAAIDACTPIRNADGLHRLFSKIEKGTKEAIDGRERTLAFLTSFRPS